MHSFGLKEGTAAAAKENLAKKATRRQCSNNESKECFNYCSVAIQRSHCRGVTCLDSIAILAFFFPFLGPLSSTLIIIILLSLSSSSISNPSSSIINHHHIMIYHQSSSSSISNPSSSIINTTNRQSSSSMTNPSIIIIITKHQHTVFRQL